ncbi:hypothetical protein Tco_0299501, partial [Tanacetum coccineum]
VVGVVVIFEVVEVVVIFEVQRSARSEANDKCDQLWIRKSFQLLCLVQDLTPRELEAEKVHQEKVQQEKLKEVKARLNFKGYSRKNSKIQEVSQHSESKTLDARDLRRKLRSRRSRSLSESPERNPSVFSRIRRPDSGPTLEPSSHDHTTVIWSKRLSYLALLEILPALLCQLRFHRASIVGSDLHSALAGPQQEHTSSILYRVVTAEALMLLCQCTERGNYSRDAMVEIGPEEDVFIKGKGLSVLIEAWLPTTRAVPWEDIICALGI